MSTKKNIIAKKRITLGTKQFVPMFEQFLNESMEEEEDEDMKNMEEIEEGGGDEDVEMESEEDMDDSGEDEGSEESEEEEEAPSEEEIEERIQEAYRRGLAKGKKLARINESSEQPPFPEDVQKYMSGAVTGFKSGTLLAIHLYNKKTGNDAKIQTLTSTSPGSKLLDWTPTSKDTTYFSAASNASGVEGATSGPAFFLNKDNIYTSVISIGGKPNENAYFGNFLSDGKYSGVTPELKTSAITNGKSAPKNLPLS
jgi:hypothetical protein